VKDSGSNIWYLFWAVTAALLGILLYNLFGFPKAAVSKKIAVKPAVKSINNSDIDKKRINSIIGSENQMPTDADKLISFTKKTACRRNVQIINNMVEFWSVKHEGLWPRADLSDIGRDKNFFPRGVPACPVDGSPYKLDRLTHRVVGHEHSDIKFDYKEIQIIGAELQENDEIKLKNKLPH